MNRIRTCLAIACCSMATVISCNKESSSSSTESLDVNLRVNECYTYSLGVFGDEERANISRQPKRSDTSVLRRGSDDVIRYKYCPTRDFIGTDQSEITSTRKSDPETTVTTIRFTIAK